MTRFKIAGRITHGIAHVTARLLAVCVLMALPVACSGGDGSETGLESSSDSDAEAATGSTEAASTAGAAESPVADAGAPTTDTSDTPGTPGGIAPLAGADRLEKQGGSAEGPPSLLADLTVERLEGFDRVTFEFTNSVPEWRVSVGSGELTADASGEPIEIGGADRLDVRMTPASRVEFTDEDPGYIEVYQGPDRVPGVGSVVTEVVLVGDFEGILTWSIALADPVDFRVTQLDDPAKLVVEIANH